MKQTDVSDPALYGIKGNEKEKTSLVTPSDKNGPEHWANKTVAVHDISTIDYFPPQQIRQIVNILLTDLSGSGPNEIYANKAIATRSSKNIDKRPCDQELFSDYVNPNYDVNQEH